MRTCPKGDMYAALKSSSFEKGKSRRTIEFRGGRGVSACGREDGACKGACAFSFALVRICHSSSVVLVR